MQATSIITLYRRIALCEITSGKISELPAITQIALGDGGVDADGEPLIPSESQDKLKHEVARMDIAGVEYPEPTTVRYLVRIPEGELTGEVINEMALVDSEGKLCAIKNMLSKGKDEDISFLFEFDDKF